MGSKNLKVLKLFVYAALLIGGIALLRAHYQDFLALRILAPNWLGLAMGMAIITLFANGYFNLFIYRHFQLNLPFREWFGLSVVNTAGNLLMPMRAGAVSNAVFLKRRYNFSYTNFISVISATYVLTFWLNALVGILALLTMWFWSQLFFWTIFLVFLGLFLGLSIVMIFNPKCPEVAHPLLHKIYAGFNTWQTIKGQPRLLVMVSLITLINLMATSIGTWAQFLALGISLPIASCFILSIFSNLSLLVSLTPASLGIREAFSGFSAAMINVPVPQAIAASVIDRFLLFSVSFLLSLYFFNYLSKSDKTTR